MLFVAVVVPELHEECINHSSMHGWSYLFVRESVMHLMLDADLEAPVFISTWVTAVQVFLSCRVWRASSLADGSDNIHILQQYPVDES